MRMPSFVPFALVSAIYLAATLVTCSSSDGAPPPPPSPPPRAAVATTAPVPLFATTEPAPIGSALRVLVDRGQLIGWIAGSTSFTGSTARIQIGNQRHAVAIDGDNTFALAVRVDKPTEAIVTAASMTQRVTLEPMPKGTRTAYFVVDRGAYRPGQKLAFAAFLRELDAGPAKPLARQRVEVRVVSQTKHAVVARMPLVSDDAGRIAGEYTFSSGDPLDLYAIEIDGYQGRARVELAEFRKSKVKLEVGATLAGDRDAIVSFRALDFLDKPIPGGTVGFTVQVVADDGSDRAPPEQSFVLGPPTGVLRRDERLFQRTGAVTGRAYDLGGQVVQEAKARVELDASGAATYRVPLRGELVRGGHRLLVDATIVDAAGREQRTRRSVPLARRDARIELATPHALVAAGDRVELQARVLDPSHRPVAATTTIVALRAQPPAAGLYLDTGYGWNGGPNGGHHWNNNVDIVLGGAADNVDLGDQLGPHRCRATAMGCRSWRARQRARRTTHYAAAATEMLVATAVVTGERATLRLDDAGAYRLIASARLADGSTVWNELGIAVRELELMPEVLVELDREEVAHGERITGVVQSRYRDAPALVVVRDATGVRARRRVVLAAGLGRIDIPVGRELGHGATVEAYVLGGDRTIHATQELLRVAQTARQLAIRTTAKPSYGPGEEVDLEIAVNRNEPVDLVVSVYDQSLLGVAPDRAVDPVAFFHGDARLHGRAGLATLQVELGDVTVEDVLRTARATIERGAGDADRARAAEFDEARSLVQHFEHGHLSVQGIAALLRHAGVQASTTGYFAWSRPILDRKQLGRTRIVDLVATIDDLSITRVADMLVLARDDANAPGRARPSHGITIGGGASGNASFSASANASYTVNVPAQVTPAMLSTDTAGSEVTRRDFSDSAHWAVTRTGADGKARVRFRLPDSLTNWRVVVTAVARDLSVGRHTASLRTLRDVMIWPMLPRQLAEGDTLAISGSVHNLTATDRDIVVTLRGQNVDLRSPATVTVRVPAGKNVPVTWSVHAKAAGLATLHMTAHGGPGLADASEKRIPIVASSGTQVVTASGFATRPLVLELPDGVEPRQAKLELTFAPSLAADMASTLDYLVEYPYGCAEQTMSRFAPAIRVAGVLENLGIKHGKLAARLPSVVDGGLKRLAGMQQPDGGWGWNGHADTHEMITPYVVWGLVEAERAGYKLSDDRTISRGLARVRELIQARLADDKQLSDRTYLMYVYSQKHRLPDAWWRGLLARRDKLSDYALGLALEIAVLRGDRDSATRLATLLHDRVVRGSDGAHWRTGGFSRWMEDRYETTAVVLKALVAYDPTDRLIPDVIAFFVATKRGDRWNSTKDTAMVLYALTDYLGKAGVKASSQYGSVDYAIGGAAPVRLAFSDGLAKKLVIDGTKLSRRTTIAFSKATPGMMVRAVVRYRASGRDLRPVADGLVVARAVYLLGPKGARIKQLKSGDRVPRGSYIESVVTVEHAQQQPMAFMLVEDPKPAGAEALPLDDPRFPATPVTWVLREDRESHVAFHHEQAPAKTSVRTRLHLETSGDLAMPPAQAELMYQTQTRGHSGTFALRVD